MLKAFLTGEELQDAIATRCQTILKFGKHLTGLRRGLDRFDIDSIVAGHSIGEILETLCEIDQIIAEVAEILLSSEPFEQTALALKTGLHLSQSLTCRCSGGYRLGIDVSANSIREVNDRLTKCS